MTTVVRGTSDTLTRDALAVLQPGFVGTTAPDWVLRHIGEGLGSVGLFGRNIVSPEQVAALTAQLRAERDDILVAIDEESGDVTRLEVREGSSFPGNYALGTVDDPGLTREVAHQLGRMLADCGVNLNWAPTADVNANPDNPVIGVRSFGDDARLVTRHTLAYVEGMQAAGVAACLKHFPGHGDTNVDSHHAMPRIDVGMDTLRIRDLPPFRDTLSARPKAVMSAHILLPALDPERPATLSPQILGGLLREELGFDGLIITDGIEMKAISATYGIERGTVLAIAAGADAICVGGGLCDEETVLQLRDALVAAVRNGDLAEERLADAAARVRSLADWTRRTRTAPEPGAAQQEGSASGPGVGLVAARRAVRVTAGELPYEPVTAAPYVASFAPVTNIAVSTETPWGVLPELRKLLPDTQGDTFDASETDASALVGKVLAGAGDRRIVAVVRDVHRHGWMSAGLDALLAARPDTVVVEMGLNRDRPRGALHIATHGAARVCGEAAAEIITGRGTGG
ncbi:glycoside hydrolase family 3 protein [Streptomyces clavuligerus]|uniref:Putative sugar hydrolase n=1 Tax=Streptomyces clavuligerus TaxID=1901 RepID=B5GQC8_STRCL|nr:glycoside hydrolase family 3 N-terminal domain-containing protein [Streptomyces clavuligerus]ANW18223.1 sugar hydrolase [Streptomyces clavuligerus]AXU12785.1 glycoside hydrolase family 3 protein [Streptomyces clavuligerus]EDY48524.1 sugar hydrolase [Streptomyces clavuligerus]EFG09172.1 Putative sugar hydrolase [Streptomyces clavuligerus]MBY6302695.1 glycoside hydrolase family 3 protein [Streptomyces clavuligerus]